MPDAARLRKSVTNRRLGPRKNVADESITGRDKETNAMSTRRNVALAALVAAAVGSAVPSSRVSAHEDACGVLHFGRSSLHVRSLTPLRDPPPVRAATPPIVGVALESETATQFDLSPQWLEQTLRDRAAAMQAAGRMPDCPFAVEGVRVNVSRTSTGYRIELRATDSDAGREVLRRAETMFHSS